MAERTEIDIENIELINNYVAIEEDVRNKKLRYWWKYKNNDDSKRYKRI